MKNIIIYSSGEQLTASVILTELQAAFTAAGYNVLLADYKAMETVQEAAELVVSGQVDFSVGFNTDGLNLTVGDGKYLYEESDVLHISIFSDAPYNMGIKDINRCCKNHAVCYLDRTHLPVLDYAYPEKNWAGKMFMPFGGIGVADGVNIMSQKRQFDVVYIANFWQLPQRLWHEFDIDKQLCVLLDDMADILICQPVSIYEAVSQVMQARGMLDEVYVERIYPYFWHLYAYCKNYRRLHCLASLVKNDIFVDVFGAGWENSPFGSKLRLHGKVNYRDNLQIMAQSKIVFTDQAEFNDGAHDRVFTAMLNGAAVVGEYSSFLAAEFVDGQDLCMYGLQDEVQPAQAVKELLNDETKRLAMTVSAYGKADTKHRWANRAERLLELAALCKLKE